MIRAFELHLFTGGLDEYEWTAVHIVTYTHFPLITINMQISSTIKRNNISSMQENLVQVYGMALHETFMFHYTYMVVSVQQVKHDPPFVWVLCCGGHSRGFQSAISCWPVRFGLFH